jgi:hypothetical protein
VLTARIASEIFDPVGGRDNATVATPGEAAERGAYPVVLRCDNGPELACGAMAGWWEGQVGEVPAFIYLH